MANQKNTNDKIQTIKWKKIQTTKYKMEIQIKKRLLSKVLLINLICFKIN